MKIITKVVLVIILIGGPIILYRFSPSTAIILGIVVAAFIGMGLLMDKLNAENDVVFSIAHKW